MDYPGVSREVFCTYFISVFVRFACHACCCLWRFAEDTRDNLTTVVSGGKFVSEYIVN